jgi:hypothetical protein
MVKRRQTIQPRSSSLPCSEFVGILFLLYIYILKKIAKVAAVTGFYFCFTFGSIGIYGAALGSYMAILELLLFLDCGLWYLYGYIRV